MVLRSSVDHLTSTQNTKATSVLVFFFSFYENNASQHEEHKRERKSGTGSSWLGDLADVVVWQARPSSPKRGIERTPGFASRTPMYTHNRKRQNPRFLHTNTTRSKHQQPVGQSATRDPRPPQKKKNGVVGRTNPYQGRNGGRALATITSKRGKSDGRRGFAERSLKHLHSDSDLPFVVLRRRSRQPVLPPCPWEV